jgi:hypothetical protein
LSARIGAETAAAFAFSADKALRKAGLHEWYACLGDTDEAHIGWKNDRIVWTVLDRNLDPIVAVSKALDSLRTDPFFALMPDRVGTERINLAIAAAIRRFAKRYGQAAA